MAMNKHYTLPRIYCPTFDTNQMIIISDQQFQHLIKVLRLGGGEFIRIFNKQQGEWLAQICNIDKKQLSLSPTEKIRSYETESEMTLIFSLIKAKAMDLIIEKCTELGVTSFRPVITERSVVHKINLERIEKQIIEAAQQCERLDIPRIHPVQKLSDCLRQITCQVLFCQERSDQPKISQLQDDRAQQIAFLVGPEGGFSKKEISEISSHAKITSISLGKNILRAETSAIAVVASYSC